MQQKVYYQLNDEEKAEYAQKVLSIVKEDLTQVLDENLLKEIHCEPNPSMRSDMKVLIVGMQKRFKEQNIYFNFSGNVNKLDELLLRKRKNLNKPLTVMIKGTEVFLSIAPLLYCVNNYEEDVNKRLDELLEEEKKISS